MVGIYRDHSYRKLPIYHSRNRIIRSIVDARAIYGVHLHLPQDMKISMMNENGNRRRRSRLQAPPNHNLLGPLLLLISYPTTSNLSYALDIFALLQTEELRHSTSTWMIWPCRSFQDPSCSSRIHTKLSSHPDPNGCDDSEIENRASPTPGETKLSVTDLELVLQQELESLKNQLVYIQALEERNEAQIDSFIDKQHQWESLEEEERHLLESKDGIVNRMEVLTEELIQLWMGAKSNSG